MYVTYICIWHILYLNSTGTFGQPEQWSLHTTSSWQHPAVPYEVLVDPLSMPAHTMLNSKTTPLDNLSSAKSEETSSEVPTILII